MNTCFVEYLQGPSTGCTCLGCASSENFITHFEETKEYSVTRTWCFWILVEAKFFIYKNISLKYSLLFKIFLAKYLLQNVFFRERSERGVCWRWDSTNNLSCESVDFILVRVWVSLYQNSACKNTKWGTSEWRDVEKKTLLWIW